MEMNGRIAAVGKVDLVCKNRWVGVVFGVVVFAQGDFFRKAKVIELVPL